MLGFDTETTGVNTREARIVTATLIDLPQVAQTRPAPQGDLSTWLNAHPGSTGVRNWLLQPTIPIPPQATAVHGVSTEYAQEHGQDHAQGLDEIAEALAHACRQGAALVAFNAPYDLAVLAAELRRHKLPSLEQRLDDAPLRVIDPLVLDRGLDRYRKGKRTLENMASHYGLATESLHTSEADTAFALQLALAIATAYPELDELSLDELHTHQQELHRAWAEDFGQWLKEQGSTRPGPSKYWPLPPQASA